ncbi:uncharacterized protein [Temnothorax nylanderi]|uniref:uncharacterized protein isoform X3 n=1 Tax=Temnothorax nylanderi TaxID=102681 RepID=UPI003A839930
MDIPAGSPSAKKRRTLTEEDKQRPLECEQKFQRPLECIRQFKLPQQFPSTMEQALKSCINVKPLSSNMNVSTSSPKSDVRVPYNLQKLRILSPRGRDLGEFNVKLKPVEPQGSTITIAKLKPVKKLLTLAPIPNPMFPQRILPKSIGNVPKKNWTQLSCGRSIISCIDNGSGLHQQQSKIQPMNIILLNDQAIKTRSHKELVKSPCPAKSKKLARNSSDKNDAPLSDKGFKANKKKRVYTAINTENGWKMIRPSRSARLGQKYNQIDKNLNDGSRASSRENFNSNEVSHMSQHKSNSLQAKSDVVPKSQMPEVNTQNVMTVIPNKTLSSNQNEVLAQASTKDVTNVPDLDTVGRETQCDDTQSEGSKAESRNDHLVVDDHARDIPEPQQITDAVQSNVQDENSPQEDLSDRLSIIKKAMDSVKDNELRELALKALADCGIGIERYVPIRPPEDHKAVHDTQVQTTVFGLLDPNSFILINKDLEDVHRVNQVTLNDMPDNENRLADDPHSNNNFVSKDPDVSEQERPFDVDSFMEEFWKEDTDALKMKETLSMTRVRCNSLLENLQRDFERVKEYDQNGMLNIHNAIVSDNVYLVRRQLIVLQHCKQSVDISTEDGVTSLELAIKYDACSEIVKLLLDAGAQPVISRSIHESAVIIASKQSSPMLPMLVSRVSNSDLLDQIDSDGLAAIHYCSIHGNLEGVRALISAGATVDLKDMKSGRTALFHAIDNSHTSVTQVLLNSGAVANIANYAGQTALSILSDPKSLAFKLSLKKDVT